MHNISNNNNKKRRGEAFFVSFYFVCMQLPIESSKALGFFALFNWCCCFWCGDSWAAHLFVVEALPHQFAYTKRCDLMFVVSLSTKFPLTFIALAVVSGERKGFCGTTKENICLKHPPSNFKTACEQSDWDSSPRKMKQKKNTSLNEMKKEWAAASMLNAMDIFVSHLLSLSFFLIYAILFSLLSFHVFFRCCFRLVALYTGCGRLDALN